jgi:DNA mismatch endonuclease (patch repair protein)
MTDIVDSGTRSRMMSGIRGKDTRPEQILRKALHARGLRYRLHDRRLPGSPDMVFRPHLAVVFVHGCFWHHHRNCRFATLPSTRADFWRAKLETNSIRDQHVLDLLLEAGWRVATVWECALRTDREAARAADRVFRWLKGTRPRLLVEAARRRP